MISVCYLMVYTQQLRIPEVLGWEYQERPMSAIGNVFYRLKFHLNTIITRRQATMDGRT